MSPAAPEVSVIIPAHNAGRYLTECINSIICQSFADWELLIADDGSTDNTYDIAAAFAREDDRIKVIRLKGSGVSCARNACADKATGKYIAFVDGDDRLDKDYLKELIRHAQDSNADITQCSFLCFDDAGNSTPGTDKTNMICHGQPEIMNSYFTGPTGNIRISVWGKLFRMDTFEGIRFDPLLHIYEDAYYIYLCCRNAKTVCVFDTPLYHYRQHEGSVMHSGLGDHYNDYFRVFDIQQKEMKDDRSLLIRISRRKAGTALWLMGFFIAAGDRRKLWHLRQKALEEYGRILLSPVPLLLKIKLTAVAVMPHVYFAALKRKKVTGNAQV